ncbi:hypothetical protein SAMN05428987_5878 [Paenibacillus sp. CF095]|nr:hypothetical protein SAMN05428987_5878 [Paenibacillus sp. CF095]
MYVRHKKRPHLYGGTIKPLSCATIVNEAHMAFHTYTLASKRLSPASGFISVIQLGASLNVHCDYARAPVPSASSSEVQCEQRVAAAGISDRQYLQALVVFCGSGFLCSLLLI